MSFKRLLFLLCLLVSAMAFAGNGVEIKTIVIDAGHGGKDPGASGPGKTNEKDVALAVALKLGEMIKKNFPDVNVIYTRKTDVFVELHERAEMANKAKADLFIAIHCNSNPNPQIYGTSTYVLGLHRTEANLEVAKRENAVILLEGDRDKNYEFDPNSPEGNIIMSMKQNAFLDQSIDIASKIESQYETGAKRKSLGVKQAGFYVIYKTAMPSLLSEIGFISNPEEEKFLASAKGQEQIAGALLRSFKDYKNEMENKQPSKGGETAKNVDEVKDDAAVPPQVKKDTVTPNAKTETANPPSTPNSDASSNMVTMQSGRKIRKPIENSSGGGIAPSSQPTSVVKPASENKETSANTNTEKKEPNTSSKPATKTGTDEATAKNTAPVTTTKSTDTVKTEHKTEASTSSTKSSSAADEQNKNQTGNSSKTTTTKTSQASTETSSTTKPAAKTSDENTTAKGSSATTGNKGSKETTGAKPATGNKDGSATATTVKKEPVTASNNSNTSTVVKKTTTTETKTTKPAVKTSSEEDSKSGKLEGFEKHKTENGLVFKVQLFAIKGSPKKADYDKIIKTFTVLSTENIASGIIRYYAGDEKSFGAIRKVKDQAVKAGYTDAFIVGFKDGVRMTPDQIKAAASGK